MDAALLGIVLDSSVLIAAERRKLAPARVVESVQETGEIPIILCAISVAEIAHGIYRAHTDDLRHRRRAFLDEMKATVPIHPLTAATAELIAKIGGEQAAQGINLPLADLIIGASAIELGYGVATGNLRDFSRIPGLRVLQL